MSAATGSMGLSTDQYIRQFNIDNAKFAPTKWLHDNPTKLKVANYANLFFTLLIGIVCYSQSDTFSTAGLKLITIGVIVRLVMSLSIWTFKNYITCNRHMITDHAYKEMEFECGKLTYKGHIPVLELSGEDPYAIGRAHGYLLGPQIHSLKKTFDFFIHTCLRESRAGEIPDILQKLSEVIPREYLHEMDGIASGFNKWAEEAGVSSRMALADVLFLHLICDSKTFHPKAVQSKLVQDRIKAFNETLQSLRGMACTTVLDRDSTDAGVIFGRNMDWCPFGKGGTYSLLMVWTAKKIASFNVPGILGVCTGWNSHRLAAAINVCPGKVDDVRGIPSALFNRLVLERCQTVPDVIKMIGTVRPLGPYHLTVSDTDYNGTCISFYQGEGGSDHIRELHFEPLQVLNWNYPECSGGYFNSTKRHELITRYYEGAKDIRKIDRQKLMENLVTMSPYINAWMTLHSLIMRSDRGEVAISWDNGYAGSMPKQSIKMDEVFLKS